MRHLLPWTLLWAAALVSCATKGTPKIESPGPFGAGGVPPLMARGSAEGGTPIIGGGNEEQKAKIQAALTPEEEIVYTDPDNPDAVIPELADLLSQVSRGPWESSITVARRLSAREGKPLLIWFTDSQSSPMCKALNRELFSKDEFAEWAVEKLVRLKVDANVVVKDADMRLADTETRKIDIRHYNNDLRKRYNVHGYPFLVMLNPSGEVVGTYRGYKRGQADFRWGQLKHAEAVAANSNKAWRANLAKKGYREWQDRKGRKIFARLVSYSAGTLTFVEPDGNRSRTTEDKLSDDDRAWIAEQKRIRNMQ